MSYLVTFHSFHQCLKTTIGQLASQIHHHPHEKRCITFLTKKKKNIQLLLNRNYKGALHTFHPTKLVHFVHDIVLST